MARGHPNILVRILDSALRDKGFHRHKKTWRLVNPETIFVVDLFTSPWGDYHIELGVFLRQVSPNPNPKFFECHIRHRVESLVHQHEELWRERTSDKPIVHCYSEVPSPRFQPGVGDPVFFRRPTGPPPRIYNALDLEDATITDAERTALITSGLREQGLPFLYAWESLDKIRETMAVRDNRSTAIRREVYEVLGLPVPGGGPSPSHVSERGSKEDQTGGDSLRISRH